MSPSVKDNTISLPAPMIRVRGDREREYTNIITTCIHIKSFETQESENWGLHSRLLRLANDEALRQSPTVAVLPQSIADRCHLATVLIKRSEIRGEFHGPVAGRIASLKRFSFDVFRIVW